MKQPTADDWALLESLAGERHDLLDRLRVLRRRLDPASATDLRVAFIAGCDQVAFGVLLKHGFGLDALRASRAAGTTPLIVTSKSAMLPSPLDTFPRIISAQSQGPIQILGHWPSGVPASAFSKLQHIPHLGLFALVSRLGQPLSARERQLVETFSGLAVTAKVLFVGLSGEDANRDELAELVAYSKIVMQQSGFAGTRMLASGVWYPSGAAADSSFLVENPIDFVTLADVSCSASNAEAAQVQALVGFIQDIRTAHGVRERPLPDVSEEEALQLIQDFDGYLDALGSQLALEVKQWSPEDATTKLRWYVRDAIQSWGAYISPEGHWLKHIETLRPGVDPTALS